MLEIIIDKPCGNVYIYLLKSFVSVYSFGRG